MSMRKRAWSALLAASALVAALGNVAAVHAQMQGFGHPPAVAGQGPAQAMPQNRPAPSMQEAAPMMSQPRAIGPHTPPTVGPRNMPAPIPVPQIGAGANPMPAPQPGVAPTPNGMRPHPGMAPNAVAPQPGVTPGTPIAGRGALPWRGDIGRFQEHDVRVWQSGRWRHGPHDGRHGWWWVVGGIWYFYPAPIYPYPNPYVPAFVEEVPDDTDYWYYCPYWDQYYPYVATCPGGWRAVPAEP